MDTATVPGARKEAGLHSMTPADPVPRSCQKHSFSGAALMTVVWGWSHGGEDGQGHLDSSQSHAWGLSMCQCLWGQQGCCVLSVTSVTSFRLDVALGPKGANHRGTKVRQMAPLLTTLHKRQHSHLGDASHI